GVLPLEPPLAVPDAGPVLPVVVLAQHAEPVAALPLGDPGLLREHLGFLAQPEVIPAPDEPPAEPEHRAGRHRPREEQDEVIAALAVAVEQQGPEPEPPGPLVPVEGESQVGVGVAFIAVAVDVGAEPARPAVPGLVADGRVESENVPPVAAGEMLLEHP